MAWPEEIDQAVESTWYLKWQSEAEMNYKSRKTDDIQWYIWFLIRSFVYGYILFHIFGYLKREVPRVLGYGPIRTDPNREKLKRVVLLCPFLLPIFIIKALLWGIVPYHLFLLFPLPS